MRKKQAHTDSDTDCPNVENVWHELCLACKHNLSCKILKILEVVSSKPLQKLTSWGPRRLAKEQRLFASSYAAPAVQRPT